MSFHGPIILKTKGTQIYACSAYVFGIDMLLSSIHFFCSNRQPALLLNLACAFVLNYRPEMVVGWYHSHPGFGCWLSGVDINTQQVVFAFVVVIILAALCSCLCHILWGCLDQEFVERFMKRKVGEPKKII